MLYFFCLYQCHSFPLHIWNLLEFLYSGYFVGIFITLDLFLFNKDDVSLEERYANGIVSIVSHIIQRETVNDHREIFNSYREAATNGESWLQVINAYLNRTMRSSSIKYIIFSPKNLSQEELKCCFNNQERHTRTGLSIKQISSTNQCCTGSIPPPLANSYHVARN